jgi:hypothetical protein
MPESESNGVAYLFIRNDETVKSGADGVPGLLALTNLTA